MSEGTQYTGGFVNGRCYTRKALEDGPPLYYSGDFHFQGTSHKLHTPSQTAQTGTFSSPGKSMSRL